MRQLCCVLALLSVLATATARANTLTVTNGSDAGPGSLRQAIADAAPGDTVAFGGPFPMTIELTSGELFITTSLTISGDALTPSNVTIARTGSAGYRLIEVASGSTVTMSGVTLTGGNLQASPLQQSVPPMSFDTHDGGAIFNGGTLSLVNVVATANVAEQFGGAVTNWGTLTVSNSTFMNNGAPFGGAITNNGPSAAIAASTFTGNSSNTAGGAILQIVGAMSIQNSTVTQNTSAVLGAVVVQALQAPATLSISYSTIANNNGGGLFVVAETTAAATATYRSTIFKEATGFGIRFTGSGAQVTSLGHNLSFDSTGNLTAVGDQPNTDPLLGTLGLRGGPTATLALLAGSPAIDASDCLTDSGTITVDQRFVPRPQGASCDVGAFEAISIDPFVLDASISSRASQASVNQLSQQIAALNTAPPDLSKLDVAVSTRATQTSIDAIASVVAGLNTTDLDAPVSSRATPADVVGLGAALTPLIDTRATPADVNTRASQSSVDAIADAVAELGARGSSPSTLEIERQLYDGARLSSLYLPHAEGGHLEDVRALVASAIAANVAAGLGVGRASEALTRGDALSTKGNYRRAYDEYANAYRSIVDRAQ